jgi:hypothetical protein
LLFLPIIPHILVAGQPLVRIFEVPDVGTPTWRATSAIGILIIDHASDARETCPLSFRREEALRTMRPQLSRHAQAFSAAQEREEAYSDIFAGKNDALGLESGWRGEPTTTRIPTYV